MPTDYRTLMERWYNEVMNQGKLEVIDQLVAEGYIEHEHYPGSPPTFDGLKQTVGAFRNAFPDLRFEVHNMIVENDTVVAYATLHGTHQGEFAGIPATGKTVAVAGIDTVRFANGKAIEHWGNTDNLGMMQQLGVAPAPEQND
jgi:steroid delta-isomerase-like uncharacterized protein